MLIDWAESALLDLEDIFTYFVSINDTDTGKAIVSALIKSVTRLENFPHSGKKGKISGTRELIVTHLPYIIVYHQPNDALIEVISVVHTARLR
jgi:addiction module toxin, RelE/StbE family